MNVNVKCFANLAEGESCNFNAAMPFELKAGNSVNDLIETMNLPAEKVSLVFVNGKKVFFDAVLSDGDRVGLFPPVGGM